MLPMDEGLHLEGKYPVSFLSIDDFPSDSELAIINEKNEIFLRTCLIPHEPIEFDEHDEIGPELKRQDLKINLLLDMVGELLLQQNKLPAPVEINLSSLGMEFSSKDNEFEAGEKLVVDLYIASPTPRALKLYGEVVTCDRHECTAITFVGVNQLVQDWLEKLIFRHHRRIVAQAHESK